MFQTVLGLSMGPGIPCTRPDFLPLGKARNTHSPCALAAVVAGGLGGWAGWVLGPRVLGYAGY